MLEYLASGMSVDDVLRDFPDLTPDDIRACLAFAAERERLLVSIPSARGSCSTRTSRHDWSPPWRIPTRAPGTSATWAWRARRTKNWAYAAGQGFTLVSKDAEYETGIDTGIDMEIEMTTM